MRQVRWAATLLTLAVAASPAIPQGAGNDGKQLVGKWQKTIQVNMKDVPVVIEFAAENKMTVTVRDIKIPGTYKVTDATHVEVELNHNGQVKKERSEFKITGDTLVLKDSAGKEDKYQKAK